jgi:DNA repair exonuclease SbcCD ATPase subunit
MNVQRNKSKHPASAARRFWSQLTGKEPVQSEKASRDVLVLKRRLEKARLKNEIYRKLVGQVFAQHYNKSREAFPDHLDALPHKYSPEWEIEFKESLDTFGDLNLKPVPQLLEACGFGTEKWEKLDEMGLSRLTEVIERQVEEIIDHSSEEIPEVVRLDGEAGTSYQFVLDERGNLEESLEELEAENEDLKLAGQQALAKIRLYEELIEQLESQQAGETVGKTADETHKEESARSPSFANSELERENETLKKQLRARDNTVQVLRQQVEKFEYEMGQARDQLLQQIKRLETVTSDEVRILPSQELDQMEVDELMRYAHNLARELEIRKKTLQEGLQSVNTVRDSYEDSRQLYEAQQQELQEQIQNMSAELEDGRLTGVQDKKAADVIDKQRQQLELLSNRIRGLSATNSELDATVRKLQNERGVTSQRMTPMRRQLEEAEELKDGLIRYIMQTYDRKFTVDYLKEMD